MIGPGTDKEPFAKRIARASHDNSSRIVLALDIQEASPETSMKKVKRIFDKTRRHICGVKFHRHLILNLGSGRVLRIIREIHQYGIPCIVDDKLNDIGSTNAAIAGAYFRLGVDGLTANPFVGWKGGLEPLFKTAHQQGKGILLLVHMSHPGASEGYGQKVVDGRTNRPQYSIFARKARLWKADGVVVGATWPRIIREVRFTLGPMMPIYSPGVGAQGGDLASASEAGTDYFIVGRSIMESSTPERVVAKLAHLSTKTVTP